MKTSMNHIQNFKRVLALGMILCFSMTALAGPPIVIDKNTTDAELNALVAQEKEKGKVLEFSKVKRNADGEITKISVEYKSDGEEMEQSVSSTNGIDPITIGDSGKVMMFYGHSKGDDDKNVVSISFEKRRDMDARGLSEEHREHLRIHRENMAKHREDMIKHREDMAKLKEQMNEALKEVKEAENFDFDSLDVDINKLIADLDLDEIDKIIESVFDRSDWISMEWTPESKPEPYVVIDGEESNTEAMNNLDPNQIAKVEILKGENATAAYGDKGANGVIIVTTKKD